MFETIDKLFLAGLGAMSMTRERAEKIFDDYVARGKAEKDGKQGFVRDMMDTAERTRAEMERIISEQTHRTIVSLDLPTREDIKRLEAKIDQLLRA